MEQSFPVARPLRFGPLADRAFSLFTKRFPTVVWLSRDYLVLFWASLSLFYCFLPVINLVMSTPLAFYIWICLCLPLWQLRLGPLQTIFHSRQKPGRLSPGYLLGLMLSNLLILPFFRFYALAFCLRAGEGLNWRQADQRSRKILLDHGQIVVGLLAAWVTLAYLLARLFEYLVQSCLPWIWGVFDVSVDIQVWAEPCTTASLWLLAALVLPGFELSLGLLCQEYAAVREGGELTAALEQEYGT
jgi:hypothetical protein